MRTLFCIALLAVTSTLASCLHDASATEADRNRRAQALALAKAIHAAEADVVRRTRQYHPLASLGSLPAIPPGFALKLFADRDDYVFAIKDTIDPCRYAIFSDSAGLLYEKSARAAPVIAR